MQISEKLLQLENFCQLIVTVNFHVLENFVGFVDLSLKISECIATLATLSKGLLTQKLLQLELILLLNCLVLILYLYMHYLSLRHYFLYLNIVWTFI